ncbi:hypothetical protein J6590_095418, partial [Homalodisca vitripennis]
DNMYRGGPRFCYPTEYARHLEGPATATCTIHISDVLYFNMKNPPYYVMCIIGSFELFRDLWLS